MDIIYQDASYTLHLVSDSGKLQWSKQLDAELVGGINAVDAYRNGRKQLVFSTVKSIYYLDRNGNDLNKYPITIKGGVTQPLSIFDYDNSRNYRFLATSGARLKMYDYRGDQVTGFKYESTGKISSQPIHHRKGKLDYIVFTTNNGEPKILNRVGKVRTPMKKEVYLRTPLQFSKNLITAISKNGFETQVDLYNGEVKQFNKLGDAQLRIDQQNKVVLKDQDLRINDKEIELPYGTYSNLSLSTLNKQMLISILNDADKTVYLYDTNGELISGFPVYGEKSMDLGFAKSHYLITLDDRDILIYKW